MATLELPYDYRALARQLTARAPNSCKGSPLLHLHRKDTEIRAAAFCVCRIHSRIQTPVEMCADIRYEVPAG